VSWLLRLLALPGAEYVMPALCPPFVRDRGNAVSMALHRMGWRHARAAEMWRAYASLAEPDTRQAFARTLRAVIDPGGQSVSAFDRLYLASAIPTLIIWGERDAIIPVEHAHAAHQAIPGSRLEIIDEAGHFPHVEEPARFVELLSDFLQTTSPSSVGRDDLHDLLSAQPPGGR